MPIYEYECPHCGVRFDVLQRFGDPEPETCPRGHGGIHRRLSRPAIIFKGPGFYVTDHGRNGRGTSARQKRNAGSTESVSAAKGEHESSSIDDS